MKSKTTSVLTWGIGILAFGSLIGASEAGPRKNPLLSVKNDSVAFVKSGVMAPVKMIEGTAKTVTGKASPKAIVDPLLDFSGATGDLTESTVNLVVAPVDAVADGVGELTGVGKAVAFPLKLTTGVLKGTAKVTNNVLHLRSPLDGIGPGGSSCCGTPSCCKTASGKVVVEK